MSITLTAWNQSPMMTFFLIMLLKLKTANPSCKCRLRNLHVEVL
uniref:Uncharacterized protein n=1 Tax=Rhizophora mucronata TaxID=61149 RepID=A0A2P2NMV7_RHIMU